jgi:hypothetical protein
VNWTLDENKPNSKPNGGLWPEIQNKMNECGMIALKAQFTEHDLKNQIQFIFHRGERRVRGAKGNLRKWLPNKEIQSTSYFSAVLANSAVNEKTKPILSFRVLRSTYCDKNKEMRVEKTKPIYFVLSTA